MWISFNRSSTDAAASKFSHCFCWLAISYRKVGGQNGVITMNVAKVCKQRLASVWRRPPSIPDVAALGSHPKRILAARMCAKRDTIQTLIEGHVIVCHFPPLDRRLPMEITTMKIAVRNIFLGTRLLALTAVKILQLTAAGAIGTGRDPAAEESELLHVLAQNQLLPTRVRTV